MAEDRNNVEYEHKLTNSWEQYDWGNEDKKEEELGTFQAPYGSLIITPEQIEKLEEQGIDILKLTEKIRDGNTKSV